MATAVQPPARGELGDLGRARHAAERQYQQQGAQRVHEVGGNASATDPSSVGEVASLAPTADFADEIKRLLRSLIDFFQATDEDRSVFTHTARETTSSRTLSGRHSVGGTDSAAALRSDTSQFGFYRRALEAICCGDNSPLLLIAPELSRDQLAAQATAGATATFPIRLSDVAAFDPQLDNWVMEYPADVLMYLDDVLNELANQEIAPNLSTAGALPFTSIRGTFCNHPEAHAIRDLDPRHLERLVAVKGTVIRVSSVIPEMQMAVFRCQNTIRQQAQLIKCNFEVSATVLDGRVEDPRMCPHCSGLHTMVLLHEKCVFTSKQLMKIQEGPESIPDGETPQTLFVYLYDSLVNVGRPGDRVILTGILKAVPIRKNQRMRAVKAVFRTALDVIFLTPDIADSVKVETADEKIDIEELAMMPSLIAQARALSERPDVYQLLVESFAPNIWEHADVKKGLLCQLFGSTAETVRAPDGTLRTRSRGELHVLICGDPSTAKSQLLQYVHKIAPRGVYAVGRGTSAAGLTATVMRDVDTNDFVLESGAVVLSDRGICCIDEFDKMDETTRAILHEVMEQQTVSLAKAGIVCSLNARTSILASANPIHSRYDTRRSVIENINLPPSLLSRFDLIYLLLDTRNEELDRRLADHLCGLYCQKSGHEGQAHERAAGPALTQKFMTQYIGLARATCHPRLSGAAKEELIATYLECRKAGTSGSVSATPRQLDSLVRLSKALARMQLKTYVEIGHVQEAARLMRAATYQALIDPLTGRIDMDQLHQGISAAQRARQKILGTFILEFLASTSEHTSNKDEILEKVEQSLAEAGHAPLAGRELERTLEHLEQARMIAKVHGNRYVLQQSD